MYIHIKLPAVKWKLVQHLIAGQHTTDVAHGNGEAVENTAAADRDREHEQFRQIELVETLPESGSGVSQYRHQLGAKEIV